MHISFWTRCRSHPSMRALSGSLKALFLIERPLPQVTEQADQLDHMVTSQPGTEWSSAEEKVFRASQFSYLTPTGVSYRRSVRLLEKVDWTNSIILFTLGAKSNLSVCKKKFVSLRGDIKKVFGRGAIEILISRSVGSSPRLILQFRRAQFENFCKTF